MIDGGKEGGGREGGREGGGGLYVVRIVQFRFCFLP